MKIIWVDTPTQDDSTMEPQLIDGERYSWRVISRKLHHTSLQEELRQWENYGVHSDAKYILIHEVHAINKLFCDQDCKPNEPGCRSKYIEDNHGLIISYDVILKTISKDD